MNKIIGVTVGTPLSASSVANAIKGKASGEAVALTDVSPLEHEMAVGLRSKNIWRFEDMTRIAGSTLQKTETGFIGKGGIGTTMLTRQRWFPISELDGNDLTVSCVVTPSGNNKPCLAIRYNSEDDQTHVSVVEARDLNGEFRYTFKVDSKQAPNCKYIAFAFYGNRSSSTDGLTHDDTVEWSNFQIEIDTTATAYTPYVADLSAVTLKKCGKNIFSPSRLLNETSWTLYENGVLSGNATALENIYNAAGKPYITFEGVERLTLSFWGRFEEGGQPRGLYFVFKYSDGSTENVCGVLSSQDTYYEFTTPIGKKPIALHFTWGNCGKKHWLHDIQIEEGTTATEYEPYHEEIYTADANGKVNGVTSLYPTTTLLTDTEGVTIEAEYNKDTKKYIDRKFAELQALILEV